MGKIPFKEAFDNFDFLKKETDPFVLSEFFHHLKYINSLIRSISSSSKEFEPLVDKLGWTLDQDRFVRILQTLVISLNIGLDDIQTTQKARDMFEEYLNKKLTCAYVKSSNESEWEKILELYDSSKDLVERDIYLNSLSCTLVESKLKNMDEKVVPQQDLASVILDVSQNRLGSKITLIEVPSLFSILVARTGGRLKTFQDFNDVKAFYSLNTHEFLKRGFDEALESIGNNIFWLDQNLESLQTYFKNN